jgi:hypothetical protein
MEDFISKKIDDVCNHIKIFFNYLSMERTGYLTPVDTNKTLEPIYKIKQSLSRIEREIITEKNIEARKEGVLLQVHKVINEDMVDYIISSIYNCKNYSRPNSTIDKISIKSKIINYIQNNNVNIENNAIDAIVEYVQYCANSISNISEDTFTKNYNSLINYVSQNKREFENYDMDNEWSKMALQSMFHITLAFLDWLELDILSDVEVDYAVEFILTRNMYDKYKKIFYKHQDILEEKKKLPEFKSKFDNFCIEVYKQYKRYNIFVSDKLCVKITTHILCMSNYENLLKTLKLGKIFAKPLVEKDNHILVKSDPYYTQKIDVKIPTLNYVKNILIDQNSPQSIFISEKLNMHPPNIQDLKPNFDLKYHWGQRKLLMSEILFFSKILNYIDEERTVVYIGAATGTHILLLTSIFPNLKFDLYDPNDFDNVLMGNKNINIYKQFFTNEDAEKYKGKNVIFISDIRTIPVMEETLKNQQYVQIMEETLKNQEAQKQYVQIMNPYFSMLKFKCPYPEDGKSKYYKYLKGIVYKQVWAPFTSAESRLIISQKDNYTEVNYDIIKHERQLAYFNLARQIDFSNEKIDFMNISLKDFWETLATNVKIFNLDFYLELFVLKDYYKKFFNTEISIDRYKELVKTITRVLNVNKNMSSNSQFNFSKSKE